MGNKKRSTLRVDGTFDIECAGWSRFVLGVTHHRATGSVLHHSARSMVETMLAMGGTWWAHNGGAYDAVCVAEELRQLGITSSFSLSGSRVSRSQGGGLTICDSYAVVPLDLDGLAAMAGLQAPALDLPCSCPDHCGGYCSIGPTMDHDRWTRLAEYCERDCVVAMAGLDAVCAFCAEMDFDLRGTIGGSSWATARRWLQLPDADMSPACWKRVRSAYHGGRCTVFRPRHAGHGRHWDITSAYPAALASASLPVGERAEHGARQSRVLLGSRAPGVYACTLDVPEMLVPPLPWLSRDRTAFPVGPVSGAWTLPDIESAQVAGCKVTDVQWSVTWSRSENVFGSAIGKWTELRRSLCDTAFAPWLRLFANSLLGKLGEQPDRRFVRMHPPRADIVHCRGQRPCTPKRCSEACNSYHQLDLWGHMWSVPYYRLAPSGHIHWAAYGNAITRATLQRGLEEQADDIVYCDTDSMWTRGGTPPDNAGDAPGQWSDKGAWRDWHAAAPKAYAFVDPESNERVVRAAGLRVSAEEWDAGRAVQRRGVHTLVDAARSMSARGGLFRAKASRWSRPTRGLDTGWYGDRVLDAESGLTHPVTCEELRQKDEDSERPE